MTGNSRKQRGINRRQVLQIFALAGAAGVLGLPLLGCGEAGMRVVRRSQAMLGTVVNLTVYSRDREQAEAAVTATLARMAELEGQLSRFREESEVGVLNRTGTLETAGADLQALLQLAGRVSEASAGAFDITMLPLLELYQRLAEQPAVIVGDEGRAAIAAARRQVDFRGVRLEGGRVSLAAGGMAITLDGIAKGHIVDQGAATLAAHGCRQIYVEAGGDLLVKGGKPGREPWRIGIRNPRPQLALPLPVINADSLAVATSGDYYQPFSSDFSYHHIIDPRTGFSSPELAAVTITAPNAALADALATASLVLGAQQAMDLLTVFPGCEGYFVRKDLSVSQTAGFPV
ncbi:FAD:protein FMN transferase [Desulfurivibrio sp. D14AmB]|uniref:FAD:protein FMN transferase n=1 Tax=Desulfurivibrio sp. D14AmB TaxID=3374370 RepID=UPI00376EF845